MEYIFTVWTVEWIEATETLFTSFFLFQSREKNSAVHDMDC